MNPSKETWTNSGDPEGLALFVFLFSLAVLLLKDKNIMWYW